MSRVQEIIIADSYELKLVAFLKAIEALATRIGTLENLASRAGTSPGAEMQHVIEGPIPLQSQGKNCSNQNLNGIAAKYRKPKINLLEKFDNTKSKFKDL